MLLYIFFLIIIIMEIIYGLPSFSRKKKKKQIGINVNHAQAWPGGHRPRPQACRAGSWRTIGGEGEEKRQETLGRGIETSASPSNKCRAAGR
jgi:hypothetical protein